MGKLVHLGLTVLEPSGASNGTASPQPASAAAAAPAASFSASPASIQKGQPVTLQWSSSNATGVYLQGYRNGALLGSRSSLPLSGSRVLYPSLSVSWVLTAIGPGGTVSRMASVQVSQPAVSAPAVPSPAPAAAAEPVTVTAPAPEPKGGPIILPAVQPAPITVVNEPASPTPVTPQIPPWVWLAGAGVLALLFMGGKK